LKNLIFRTKIVKPLDKIEESIKLYREIIDYHSKLIHSKGGRDAIYTFDSALPALKWISPTKKIDFFVWKIR
jgi:hypothetical protein